VVPIHENYQDYRPPRYARPTIARLLLALPQHYLLGLQSVVLTNAAAIGRGKTRRIQGKKYLRNTCLGWYYPKWKGEPAWIEIVVDNIIAAHLTPSVSFLIYIPIIRDFAFADTLFHEVGHHLDHTIGAPAPSGEAAAESWNRRLMASYLRKRYSYLRHWCFRPLLAIAKALVASVIRRLEAAEKAPL
jgi:hypothetical protein